MFESILFAFWFFLPAGLANMFPVFAARIPGLRHLEYPMDFHLAFRGKRVLGPHKTLRGLVVGIVIGILTMWLQKTLYIEYESIRQFSVDYTVFNPVYLGGLLGLGAILGDALKSFFKRQVGVPSGEAWLFFDQVDYILGGLLCIFWYAPLTISQYIYILIVYTVLHLVINIIGYFLGLKKDLI